MYESIQRHKKLSKERRCPSFWADNIIDSEKLCENDEEQKHFYQYIMNPRTYDPKLVDSVVTLGQLEDCGMLKDDIEKYPAGFETKVFKNGNEIILNVCEVKGDVEEDDEKAPK